MNQLSDIMFVNCMCILPGQSTITTHQRRPESSLPVLNTVAVGPPTSTQLHGHSNVSYRDPHCSPHGETLKRNSWRSPGEWMTCIPPTPTFPPSFNNSYQNFCNITLLVQRPTKCWEVGVAEDNCEILQQIDIWRFLFSFFKSRGARLA
jgi:hypothetical protein